MEQEIDRHYISNLLSVLNSVKYFFTQTSQGGLLYSKVSEEVEKAAAMHRLFKESDKPNWYMLYEGLCGSHVALKAQLKEAKAKIAELEDKVLSLKYGNYTNQQNESY